MRAARPGSVPWTQTLSVYLQGTMVTGRIGDLLAVIQQLREVELTPEAADRMRLPLFVSIGMLDLLGRIEEGTELEARYWRLVRPTRDRSPVARLGWNLMLSFRASFAHEDPWLGLVRGEENLAIYEVIGGEHNLLLAQLFLGANRFFLGASASAEEMLRGLAAADTTLGMGSSLRRVLLALLLAERGAFDEAREIASQLAERGRANGFALEAARGGWALAEALRRAGDMGGAERELGLALPIMVPLELPGALATQAALRLAQGRAGDALAAAEDGLARFRAAGGCGFFRGGCLRLVHAEALHATGAHVAARAAIGEAKARVLAIADRIGDPAYRRSFLEDVPEVARTLALALAWLGDPTPDDPRRRT
jgi:eukaryotic-like serine/threonine-protein kinase